MARKPCKFLALAAALAFASALMATPPPELCLNSEMYIESESWIQEGCNFDSSPPGQEVVIAAITESSTGWDSLTVITGKRGYVIPEENTTGKYLLIAQIANKAGSPNRYLLTWYDKGHDSFRRDEKTHASVDGGRRINGKQGYLVPTEYRHPLLC